MAEFFTLCGREWATDIYTPSDLETIADRILPENAPRDIEVIRNNGLVTCTINAPESLSVHETSVALGQMIPHRDDWHNPGAPVPDGSYGIVRTDEETVELISDATASRTIYYRLFEDLFVFSSSQRAIAHFADDFVIDEAAIAWMVSSGGLGPSQTWDQRIDYVVPDSRVRLNRSTWELTKTTQEVTFNPINESKSVHRDRLAAALDDTFEKFDVDTSRWELPLSGGLDSRTLLLRLQNQKGLRTLTWGTEAAHNDPESDAVRARELAEACDVPHRYYTLPETPENAGEILDRFVTAGEGRIDHVSGYLDGFGIFEDLPTRGVDGLIRGDEGFGWTSVGSSTAVRRAVGAQTIDDYKTLPGISIPGEDQQRLPEQLTRRSGESLATWRDRLYHIYRLPVILGALTALKTPYIEVVNPFLTRQVLETVREFPDQYRTEKQLYAEYARERGPEVPVAMRGANPDGNQFLATEESRTFLQAELDTTHARTVLGTELVNHAIDGLEDNDMEEQQSSGESTLTTIKRQVGSRLPSSLIKLIETHTPVERPPSSMPEERLAFRLYIISTMVERLEDDADYL